MDAVFPAPPASASRTEEQQWTRHEALRDLSVQLRHRLGDGTQITTQTKATFQPHSRSATGQQRDDNKEKDASLQQGDLCWYGTRKRSVPHHRSRGRLLMVICLYYLE